MEVQEEAMAAGGLTDQVSVSKGKRTKRQRPMSPFVLTMATSSYSSAEGSGSGDSGAGGGVDRLMTASSPSSDSGEFTQSTTVDEEADMANCLILLAQGGSQKSPESVLAVSKVAGGSEVYQCKTCNRCFPSFQALGGHRASHKKPNNKAVTLEEKKHVVLQHHPAGHHHHENVQFNDDVDNTTLSLQIRSRDINVTTSSTPVTNKSRVHECSICGAEFSSGQALGGHMRRHRPITTTTAMATTTSSSHEEVKKKPRTLLSLDLNLPAPEDDHHHHHRESKFPFAPKEQVIVFSASPLVDCHY